MQSTLSTIAYIRKLWQEDCLSKWKDRKSKLLKIGLLDMY